MAGTSFASFARATVVEDTLSAGTAVEFVETQSISVTAKLPADSGVSLGVLSLVVRWGRPSIVC